jgi:glycine/D-amino acid oxidase-like deaminating enzyme/nitrite reductase/ring-hydroxylating ferredoxin subunit
MCAQRGSTSLWAATAQVPDAPALMEDAKASVCIVGAGIAGLTTAYELARQGSDVIVVDQTGIGQGQTARSTGHLCDALDDRFHHLASLFGVDRARLAAQSHREAVAHIERICATEGIDCDFERVDGYLVLGEGAEKRDELDQELAGARDAGLAVDAIDAPPGSLAGFGRAVRFGHQAQFHPLKYMAGLARAIERRGGRIYGHTRVTQVHDGGDAGIETERGPHIRAGAVVVASNTPFNDRVTMHTKQAAYRTYVLALRIAEGSVPPVLLWDTLDPYHYVRTARIDGQSWLIVGGEDHKVGQSEDPEQSYARLESWIARWLPVDGDVVHRWSGQVYEPVDSLGFFGRNPGGSKTTFIATGDSGNGLTHGTLAGITLSQLIRGQPAPYAELYDPARRTLKAGVEYLRENANMAVQYRDRVLPGELADVAELAPGTGAVVRQAGHLVAAFRDEAGALHLHSAICPHLGGVVHFNPAEGSFDCPVHGSRFDAGSGACLNGPAAQDLSRRG